MSSIRTPPIASSRHSASGACASSTLPASSFSTPSSAGTRAKKRCRASCARPSRAASRPAPRRSSSGRGTLDEPGGRAVGEALELRHGERRARAELLEHERMREPRRPVEGRARARASAPSRSHGRVPRPLRVPRGELRERPQPLTLGRRLVERPGQRRERPPACPAAHVVGVEERLHVVPERARLTRAAVVVGRLAHEIEPLRGARARRVEEIAVVLDRIRPLEPRAPLVERAPRVVVEERRAAAAPRQAPLLQPEHEDGVEAARARAKRSTTATRPASSPARRAKRGTLDRGETSSRPSSPLSSRQPSSSASSRLSVS